VVYDIIYNVRRGQKTPTSEYPRLAKISKSFLKPLDKIHFMWYNIRVVKGRTLL
jgi:hypothetical protein